MSKAPAPSRSSDRQRHRAIYGGLGHQFITHSCNGVEVAVVDAVVEPVMKRIQQLQSIRGFPAALVLHVLRNTDNFVSFIPIDIFCLIYGVCIVILCISVCKESEFLIVA